MDSNHQEFREILKLLERSLKVLRDVVETNIVDFSDRPGFTLQRYVRLRRLREKLLPEADFHDPAWDILLDLRMSEKVGRSVSVSSACIAAAVPPTTALRHIALLVQSGLIVRESDQRDGRRIYLRLSEEASGALAEWEEEAATSMNVRRA